MTGIEIPGTRETVPEREGGSYEAAYRTGGTTASEMCDHNLLKLQDSSFRPFLPTDVNDYDNGSDLAAMKTRTINVMANIHGLGLTLVFIFSLKPAWLARTSH